MKETLPILISTFNRAATGSIISANPSAQFRAAGKNVRIQRNDTQYPDTHNYRDLLWATYAIPWKRYSNLALSGTRDPVNDLGSIQNNGGKIQKDFSKKVIVDTGGIRNTSGDYHGLTAGTDDKIEQRAGRCDSSQHKRDSDD
jgi:hypothetical protein